MTRQEAISAKCKDCIYDPANGGTWLKQVELCTFTDCSLYPYRPIPKASKPKGASRTRAQIEATERMREGLKNSQVDREEIIE